VLADLGFCIQLVSLNSRSSLSTKGAHGVTRKETVEDCVSVIIVNWNGEKYLPNCLEALRKQVVKPDFIHVVDNGSSDCSVEILQSRYPEVQMIQLDENLGFAIGNNIALKTVSTEFVALLNNDAIPHPLWLTELLKALEEHPEAGFAASKMLYYNKPGAIDRAGDVYTRAGTGLLRGRGKPSEAYNKQEYVFGACAGAALYRTEMLKDIGWFDEDFFILYEDVDLSFRAQLRGYKCVYVPEAVVYHVGSSSIGDDTPTSVYYSHRNLEWVYIKNMPVSLIKRTIVPHLIYDLAAFLFFTAKRRGGDFLKAKWDAFKGIRLALEKREKIQKSKEVSDSYIWSLLEKERFLPRLTRRVAKSRT
jgi:GT2 family glycosyltransferase